ncbi:Alpha/Beta hydrolase protein [Calycina marina]|uniref:Alpha/Beta hydrolase protein n=1 Tax=Calycina marina TaxID=1763456 RepID=A0A9P8CGJ0_9HELO|nr:Alpha/Beta hydrolase protein [Calycina marina]
MALKDLSQSTSYRSQMATRADISFLEKLQTIPNVMTVIVNVLASLFTAAIYSKDSKPAGGLYKHVAFTGIRTMIRKMSVKQIHYLNPHTDDAYVIFCKKNKLVPNSEVLPDGTRAHWIGDRKADVLIMNFHGGGYVIPAGPDHFELMHQIVRILNTTTPQKSVAILFLAYDLAPTAIYPRQLQQAALLLNHVIQNLHVAPSNIILTGNSAGANLVTGLLSHISHPHPSLEIPIPKVEIAEDIRAAMLLNPWVSFDTDEASYKRNTYKDTLVAGTLQNWSAAFIGEAWPFSQKSDYYNQAVTAPASWWSGLRIGKVLVIGGGDEVLIDGIKIFAGKLKEGLGEERVELCVVKGGYHDQINIDLTLGYSEEAEGEQAKLMKRWLRSKL